MCSDWALLEVTGRVLLRAVRTQSCAEQILEQHA